ncbi:hypothetical protein KCU78_g1639, partial [Aureobasidium melanogenum]
MVMEGVVLNPVSDPSPQQVQRDVSILETRLNELVLAVQDLDSIDVRNAPNKLTAEQLQRRFVACSKALKQYVEDAQKLNQTFQSLSDTLQTVQELTTDVESLKAQVNEEHTLSSVTRAIDSSCNTLVDTFKELSTTEKEAQRLRTQALQSLSMDVKMKGLMDASSDRVELNNYRKQQSHLDAIQLQAQDRADLVTLRNQQPLQITVDERTELATLRAARAQFQALQLPVQDRADLVAFRNQQPLQITVNERTELATLRAQRDQFRSLQIAINERSELTMLREENKILREQKVSADQMRLDSNERPELTMLRRLGVQAFNQLGEVHQAVTGSGASEGIVGSH